MTTDGTIWTALGLASHIVLWLTTLFLAFLLLGILRALGLLKWQLEQLEATTPSRLGRSGLKPGKKAPDFTLPSVAGNEVALRDFLGRKVLLVFTQSGCGPCEQIIPELNRLRDRDFQVLVLNKGETEVTRQWAAQFRLQFPLLIQNGVDISKKYEAFATPFAFLINEEGVVVSRGIASSKQQIGYVLSGACGPKSGHGESQSPLVKNKDSEESQSISTKEVHHV